MGRKGSFDLTFFLKLIGPGGIQYHNNKTSEYGIEGHEFESEVRKIMILIRHPDRVVGI